MPRSPLCFTRRDGQPWRSFRTAFRTACTRAGLGADVTPHTLRHTFASKLAMAGVDVRTIQELGGWSTITMVERYTHLSPSHRDEAIARLDAGRAGVPAIHAKFHTTLDQKVATVSVTA